MKTRSYVCFALCLIWAYKVCAADPNLMRVGRPFRFDIERIEWQAPLDHLPETLPVYRIVDREFPAGVVSNLMKITSFTIKERTLNHDKAMRFNDADRDRSLFIMPKRAAVHYCNPHAVSSPGQPVEGVLTREETLDQALEIVRLLGIERSELATEMGTEEFDVTWGHASMPVFDSYPDSFVVVVSQRSVTFRRQYREIPSLGLGGGSLSVEFGNHGELSQLQMSWRPIAVAGEYPVATKDQFLRWIDQGQCVFVGNVAEGERLTIRGIQAYYLERPYDDEEAEDWVRPVACLGATVESRGNQVPIRIFCPLVIEEEGAGQIRREDTAGAEEK